LIPRGSAVISGMSSETDPRTEGPVRGDERAMLVGFLHWQRETLEMKCAGLDAADLARRAAEPSTLSLLGLVRHMAEVERSWFRRVMSDQDTPPYFYSDTNPDGDFDQGSARPRSRRGSVGSVARRDRVCRAAC
jgi:hypothetical protein